MPGLTPQSIEKLRDLINYVEGLPPILLGSADYDVDAGPPCIEVLKATTSTPDGNGWYTAFVETYNVATNTFTDGDAALLKDINDNPLTEDTYYIAKAWDYDTVSGTLVWLTDNCCGSGGGGSDCCSTDEPPGYVLMGPSSGPDAPPTYRPLVPTDIPSLPYASPGDASDGGSGSGTATTTLTTIVSLGSSLGNVGLKNTGSTTMNWSVVSVGAFGNTVSNGSTLGAGFAINFDVSVGNTGSNPHDSGPNASWQLKVNTSSGTTTYSYVTRVV